MMATEDLRSTRLSLWRTKAIIIGWRAMDTEAPQATHCYLSLGLSEIWVLQPRTEKTTAIAMESVQWSTEGAWWYNHGHNANPVGLYQGGGYALGITWLPFRGQYHKHWDLTSTSLISFVEAACRSLQLIDNYGGDDNTCIRLRVVWSADERRKFLKRKQHVLVKICTIKMHITMFILHRNTRVKERSSL